MSRYNDRYGMKELFNSVGRLDKLNFDFCKEDISDLEKIYRICDVYYTLYKNSNRVYYYDDSIYKALKVYYDEGILDLEDFVYLTYRFLARSLNNMAVGDYGFPSIKEKIDFTIKLISQLDSIVEEGLYEDSDWRYKEIAELVKEENKDGIKILSIINNSRPNLFESLIGQYYTRHVYKANYTHARLLWNSVISPTILMPSLSKLIPDKKFDVLTISDNDTIDSLCLSDINRTIYGHYWKDYAVHNKPHSEDLVYITSKVYTLTDEEKMMVKDSLLNLDFKYKLNQYVKDAILELI